MGNIRNRRTLPETGTVKKVERDGELWWQGTYHHRPTDANGQALLNAKGKPIRNRRSAWIRPADKKSPGFMTEQEAQREIWRISSIENGRIATGNETTLPDLLETFNRGRLAKRERASAETATSMANTLKENRVGKLPVQALTAEMLCGYIDGLPSREWCSKTIKRKRDGTSQLYIGKTIKLGMSVSFIKKMITAIRRACDLAVEMRLITINPARSVMFPLEVPKAAKKVRKSLLPWRDYYQLLHSLEAEGNKQDALILEMAFFLALRPNELLALKAKDVIGTTIFVERAFDRGKVEKETKTGKVREITMQDQVAPNVWRWIKDRNLQPEDYLFTNRDGKPYALNSYLKRHLRTAAVRAGIATIGVDFRMLRRSFGSRCQDGGVNPKATQAQMGHEGMEMTAIVYMQTPEREIMRREMNKLYQYAESQCPPEIRAKREALKEKQALEEATKLMQGEIQ